jgi:hypothetical protein
VVSDHTGMALLKTELGGSRILDVPFSDQLPDLLKEYREAGDLDVKRGVPGNRSCESIRKRQGCVPCRWKPKGNRQRNVEGGPSTSPTLEPYRDPNRNTTPAEYRISF